MTVNRDRAQIWYSVTILSDDTQRLYTDESAGINSVSPNGSFGLHSTRRAVPGAFRRKKQMKLILTHLESSNGLESSGKITDEMSSDSRYNLLNSNLAAILDGALIRSGVRHQKLRRATSNFLNVYCRIHCLKPVKSTV